MKIKRQHLSSWLSNMSVGTFIIGAFQNVEQFQFLGEKAQIITIILAGIEFFISYLLAPKEE